MRRSAAFLTLALAGLQGLTAGHAATTADPPARDLGGVTAPAPASPPPAALPDRLDDLEPTGAGRPAAAAPLPPDTLPGCSAVRQRCEALESDRTQLARQRDELEQLRRQVEQARTRLDEEQRRINALRQQADRDLRDIQSVRRQIEINRREIERHLQRQIDESEQLEQEQRRSTEELRRHQALGALREQRLVVAGLMRAVLDTLPGPPRPQPDPGRAFMKRVADAHYTPADVQQLLQGQLEAQAGRDARQVRRQLADALQLMQRHLVQADRLAAALLDAAQRERVQAGLRAEHAALELLRARTGLR